MKIISIIFIAVTSLCSFIAPEIKNIVEYPSTGAFGSNTILQVIDSNKIPQYYYIEIPKFNCQTKKDIKEAAIRLYWDAFGNYIRYELVDGSDLIKLNSKPFSSKEYNKLHKILNNPNSKLKLCKYAELTGRECENQFQVDAISGATESADDIEIVTGATKITYDLWKLAYGDISSQIRDITADIAADFEEDQLTGKSLDISNFNEISEPLKFAFLNRQLNSIDLLTPEELDILIDSIDINNYAIYSGIIENIKISKRGVKGYLKSIEKYNNSSNSFISWTTANAFLQIKDGRYIKELEPNFRVVEF